MSESRILRSSKKQLGQFMTPVHLSKSIVSGLDINIDSIVLEPSFGDGSFIIAIIEKLIQQGLTLEFILDKILYGVELDTELYEKTLNKIETKWGYLPKHNLVNADFFETDFQIKFTHIIGNPPFGGTIAYKYQVKLENLYGKRFGNKIKKETYSFFTVKSVDMLAYDGVLVFICSDTFLSIKTMSGLRKFFQLSGYTEITKLQNFSEETNYPMVIIDFKKDRIEDYLVVDRQQLKFEVVDQTSNSSWSMDESWSKYFSGPLLSKYILASGGLSTGKNEYFIRDIIAGEITETYNFEYFQDTITLEKEISKAKLNKLGDRKTLEIREKEKTGQTVENVRITTCHPYTVKLPNSNYSYYNKATNEILWSEPLTAIYWKDNGKAVLTFKKNGNWYLHGVGGANFFKKEGLTWQLISKRINARYLPEGYILDNSSPVAILRDGVDSDELYFILGWLLTDLATSIQKEVINHTKNIQNKDIERLPYPHWVDPESKSKAIELVKLGIKSKRECILFDQKTFIKQLNNLYKI
jgi:hypothetical protein